jgi:site-specific recombinase XerD
MLTEFRVTPALTWNEAFASWLHSTPTRRARRRSKLTMDAYLADVRLFGQWFERVNGQTFTPDLLNTTDVTAYFSALETQAKPATYNRKLASMRMLLAWARGEGLLEYDPAAWVPFLDATRESPRDVQADEWEKLEAAAEGHAHLKREDALMGLRDLLIFRLLGSAGLRIHEVVGLKVSDLHLEDGFIHVLGKGQKHRKVRVGGKLVTVIREWLAVRPATAANESVVTDLCGQAIVRGSAGRRFTMIAEMAGVKTTPHAMRHTYIYRFMDAFMAGDKVRLPAAIDAVCQQTGDRPEVILKYYTRARESEIRAVAEVM